MKLNKRLGIISALLIATATPLVAMETPTSNASQSSEQSEPRRRYFDDMKKPAQPKSILKLFMLNAMKSVAKTTRKVGQAFSNGEGEQVKEEFKSLDEMEQIGFGAGVLGLMYVVFRYSKNLVSGMYALLKAFGCDDTSFKKGQEQATEDLKKSKYGSYVKPFFKKEAPSTPSSNNNADEDMPAGYDPVIPALTNR